VAGARTLCLVLFVLGHSLVNADEQDLMVDDAELQQGKGVIIELEEETALAEEETTKTPVNKVTETKNLRNKKRVELIVGGQGDNGVAKRSTLVIDD
jgi:hypothetical protein